MAKLPHRHAVSVGPVPPLVEGVADSFGSVGVCVEVGPVVEHVASRLDAVVVVDDVTQLAERLARGLGGLLASGEAFLGDGEHIVRGLDAAAS